MSDDTLGFDWVGAGIVLVTAGALGWFLDATRLVRGDAAWAGPVTMAWLTILGLHLRSRWLRRRPAGLTTGEMAAERLAELEVRLAELENRVDFSERLLTDGPARVGEALEDRHG